MKNSFLLVFALIPSLLHAQFNLGFREVEGSINIEVDGTELTQPAVGGFNTPQFSEIDLNEDGDNDLFVFDRSNDIVRTFLFKSNGNGGTYEHAPEYESAFPDDLKDFALLRDFNCDGKADIFTFYQAGFRVYNNTSGNGVVSFDKFTDEIESDYGSITTSAFVLAGDVPAIVDVDLDGDLDILTFGNVNSENTIEFHRNLSIELYDSCDSLEFEVVTQCWGNVQEPAEADSLIQYFCKGVSSPGRGERMHPGSTVLLIDTDGDDDKDLILGDIQTNKALHAINAGDINVATIDVTQQTNDFPNADDPVRMQYLVAGYEIDVDHDGIQDLLMSVNNSIDSSVNTNHVWYYNNAGANAVDYSLISKEFLVGDMLDLGANTTPEVMDVNGDGLLDILIASDYIRGPNFNRKSRLYLLEQQTDGGFELTDEDYAGLSAFKFEGANISLGDMDADGDLDMILGDAEGELHYFRNDEAGGVANFLLVEPIYMGINTIGSNASPDIADINLDGLPDLLVGERIGIISYFENIGTASVAEFNSSPTIEEFGGIDVSEACCSGYSTPQVVSSDAFGPGRFLFVGSSEKRIDIFSLSSNPEDNLIKQDSLYFNAGRLNPIPTDLDDDGIYELLCGTAEGGIKYYTRFENYLVGTSELTEQRAPNQLSIYPNPANGLITLRFNDPFEGDISIIDLQGRIIKQMTLKLSTVEQVDLSDYDNGLYFIHCQNTHELITGSVVIQR